MSVPNLLLQATSPYLQQHAWNPVRWQEWNSTSLEQAKQTNKPILVSIGYSSCHWCHVMERESFENEAVAQFMSDNFVCIKVDREERPDIDQVYMEAVQAMGGHGGWPLNVFLTPDQKPFYGGTYYQREHWMQLLRQISATWEQKQEELKENAEQLTKHIATNDLERFGNATGTEHFVPSDAEPLFRILSERFDSTWGGIEKAPKFVMPSIWLFLLRYHALTGNSDALEMVRFTLVKMQQGGLYDQLGGGFSRYSVDREWFAPHFEKMLYDNAQLLTLYSEAYAWTHDPSFRKVVEETAEWLKREMKSTEGGLCSALDADSENSEGKFYSWTWDELETALGEDTPTVAAYFTMTRDGNWEHGRNILMDTSTGETPLQIRNAKQKLFQQRSNRIRPGLDDKLLAGWNAMAITGLIDAYNVFGNPEYLVLAEETMNFVETKLIMNGKLMRSFKGRISSTEGFLEDYTFLIHAYLSLYQSTFNEHYIEQSERWCNYVLGNFEDTSDGYFNFTSNNAEPLIARKKEIFDNVIPGSNSVMARNLFHLAILLDRPEWKEKAMSMITPLKDILQKEPGYLSNWGILLTELAGPMAEIVITGPDAEDQRKALALHPLPFSVRLGTTSHSKLSLLQGRSVKNDTTAIYVCYNKTCQLPVRTAAEALHQLKSGLPLRK